MAFRNFFPGNATPHGNRKDIQPRQEELINQTANSRLRQIQRGGPFHPGERGDVTPESLRNTAALMALQEKVKQAGHHSRATSPAERAAAMSAQADFQEEQERQALLAAARDIHAGAMSEVGTRPVISHFDGDRADGQLDGINRRGAAAIASNMAQGKVSQFDQAPPPVDPRMTTQGRAQFQRHADAHADAAASAQRKARGRAETDARNAFVQAGGSPTQPGLAQNPLAALQALVDRLK